MECYYCKGRMVRGKTTYAINRQGYHLLIDDVPAWICQQCGEAYYDPEQGKAIEEILKTMDNQVKRLQAPMLPTKP